MTSTAVQFTNWDTTYRVNINDDTTTTTGGDSCSARFTVQKMHNKTKNFYSNE